MAGNPSRDPEQYQPLHQTGFHAVVSEFATEVPGALSPFGADVQFPLPVENLSYAHPSADDRPRLIPRDED